MIRSLALVLVLVACGGSKPAPATSVGGSNASAGSNGSGGSAEMAAMREEMASMPPDVAKFHDVLAPRWHAPQGPQRMKDTCDALPDFHTHADAIAKATPPTTANADTWTTATKALVAAVAGLDPVCKANDPAQFEVAFGKVHQSFHGLLAAAGGEHHEEGMHEAAEQHKM